MISPHYTFSRDKPLYFACNDQRAFFTSDVYKNYNFSSCQNVCEAIVSLFDNISIRFGNKLYRQIIGIPMALTVFLVLQICSYFVIREIYEVSLTGKSG